MRDKRRPIWTCGWLEGGSCGRGLRLKLRFGVGSVFVKCVCVCGCVCSAYWWRDLHLNMRPARRCSARLSFSLPVCCCYCCCYSPCCCCSAYCALQFSHVDKLVSTLNSRSALHLPLPLHLPPAVAVILPVVCLIIGIVVVCVRILRPCQGKFVF